MNHVLMLVQCDRLAIALALLASLAHRPTHAHKHTLYLISIQWVFWNFPALIVLLLLLQLLPHFILAGQKWRAKMGRYLKPCWPRTTVPGHNVAQLVLVNTVARRWTLRTFLSTVSYNIATTDNCTINTVSRCTIIPLAVYHLHERDRFTSPSDGKLLIVLANGLA